MASYFRSMSGNSSEEEAYSPSFYEEPVHEDLHTPADATKLAQDLEFVATDPPTTETRTNTSQCQDDLQTDDVSDSDTDSDGNSTMTKSDKLFKEGFRKRRASPMEGLRDFQAAIKALMEDMYEAKIDRTGSSFKLHHWLSDRGSRALFGLYGPKGDTSVEPSWRLFLEMLFKTDDNLNLAAAYPVHAQKAVFMAMEILWSPTNHSMEQALQAVRAEVAPEPKSSDNGLLAHPFYDSDNFGRFLAGYPQRQISEGTDQPQQPGALQSVFNAAVLFSGRSPPLAMQSIAQTSNQAQASQLMPSTAHNAAVATAAPPGPQIQAQPLLVVAQNVATAAQPLPPPQVQASVAPAQNGNPPVPPAQPRARYKRAARPLYPRTLVPRDFYDPAQYSINPMGWDAAHSTIATASFRGVKGFSNMGVLGPIATTGDLTGDFRACVVAACANGYIRAHHNGSPRFTGAGKDHGPIWDWYLALIQSPNGAFEEDRFRKYIMARLEQVLPANERIAVNNLRQPAMAPVAGPNVPVNAAPVNIAPVNAVPVNALPLIAAPIANNQTMTATANAAADMDDDDMSNSEDLPTDNDGSDRGSMDGTVSSTQDRGEQPDWEQDDDEEDSSDDGEAELPRTKRRRL